MLEGLEASWADWAVGRGLAGRVERGPPDRDDVVKGSDEVEVLSLESGCPGHLQGVLGCQGRGWVTDVQVMDRMGCLEEAGGTIWLGVLPGSALPPPLAEVS